MCTVGAPVKSSVTSLLVIIMEEYIMFLTISFYTYTIACSNNCKDRVCEKLTGKCNCVNGFYGEYCDKGLFTIYQLYEKTFNNTLLWSFHFLIIFFVFVLSQNFCACFSGFFFLLK